MKSISFLSYLFRPNKLNGVLFQMARAEDKMIQFTEIFDKKAADDQNKKVSSGRAWGVDELRLKSNEDLHKLWYVLLKEKNLILSDNALKRKLHGSTGPQGKMIKLKASMARLLTIINERKKIREDYRRYLEDQYVEKQRKVYEEKLREEQAKQELQPVMPEISHKLLRAKYNQLRQGIDNTEYIQKMAEQIQQRQQLKKELDQKYDYKNKKVVPNDQNVEPGQENKVIKQFSSMFDEQLKSGKPKISEDEVLRAHVKNWKMLNLKQRRIIVNFLNARRAKDAKKEFLKELNLLSQKIAYDSMQERMKLEQTAKK